MSDLGKSLVIAGLAIALAGALIWSGAGRTWLGRLPGDIHIRRAGSDFYFPVATCLVLSLALSLAASLLRGRH